MDTFCLNGNYGVNKLTTHLSGCGHRRLWILKCVIPEELPRHCPHVGYYILSLHYLRSPINQTCFAVKSTLSCTLKGFILQNQLQLNNYFYISFRNSIKI